MAWWAMTKKQISSISQTMRYAIRCEIYYDACVSQTTFSVCVCVRLLLSSMAPSLMLLVPLLAWPTSCGNRTVLPDNSLLIEYALGLAPNADKNNFSLIGNAAAGQIRCDKAKVKKMIFIRIVMETCAAASHSHTRRDRNRTEKTKKTKLTARGDAMRVRLHLNSYTHLSNRNNVQVIRVQTHLTANANTRPSCRVKTISISFPSMVWVCVHLALTSATARMSHTARNRNGTPRWMQLNAIK